MTLEEENDYEPSPPPFIGCSFCGRQRDEVEVLIAGPAAMICNICIDLCVETIKEHRNENPRTD